MAANDTPEGLELLRDEVPEHLVGKLPKVTCFECRKKENRGECKDHRKRKCDECGGWLTPAHMHLDYVGHAETTSKLLEADIAWNWEPLAFDANGLPAFDVDGGLWIKLTVCGVTRLGYGTADNANGFKARGDLRKEIIGDALRNAAMRFGWALNLWAKTDIHERTPQEDEPQTQVAEAVERKARREQRSKPPASDEFASSPDGPPNEPPKANPALVKAVNAALTKHGISERNDRLARVTVLIGRNIDSTNDLTVSEAQHVLRQLPQTPAGGQSWSHGMLADRGAPLDAGLPEGWSAAAAEQLAADFLAELQGSTNDAARVEIAGRIAKAVKAGKITAQDRDTLLAAYNGAQGKQPVGTHA